MTYNSRGSEYWREVTRKRLAAVNTDGCRELTCTLHGLANVKKREAIEAEVKREAATSS